MTVRIYTRGGDKGMTGIHGGDRVPKDDIRIEANGCLDELNSAIGVVRSFMSEEDARHEILFRIQKEMMTVMSHVATPAAKRENNPNPLDDKMVEFCEKEIDEVVNKLTDNQYFVLPGGNLISSHLHLARTIARRSERRLWTLHNTDPLPESILKFVNRLSDLFFVMARFEMQQQGTLEERWHKFLYKKKKTKE